MNACIESDQRVIYLPPKKNFCYMSEALPESVKHIVYIKQVEKPIKITDQARQELQATGMMDGKGKLKIKGVSPKITISIISRVIAA
jgi:hypothetical protein